MDKKTIAIGCDHGGYILKPVIVNTIKHMGYEILDFGTNDANSTDYPQYAKKVAEAVSSGLAQKGIIVCGSGVGMCITANKVKGIRASIAHDIYSAHQCVEHDDVNVLCLGGRVIGVNVAQEIVKSFLSVQFSNQENHLRRLNKIIEIEDKNFK